MNQTILWEGDTAYGHYQVVDTLYDGRPARVLYSGDRQAAQSGVAKDNNPDLLFDYNQRMFELATNLVPQKVLLLGGGTGTLPTALLARFPGVHINVVEPDKGLTKLGYEYFDLPVDERLRFFHTDGRTYLRQSSERYDMVFVDAFNHTAIPEDMRTLEAFEAYHAHLKARGLLAMNIISGYYSTSAAVLRQTYAATCKVFDEVDVFLASRGYTLWLPQNFVLAAQKGTHLPLKDYVRHEAVKPPEVNLNEIIYDR